MKALASGRNAAFVTLAALIAGLAFGLFAVGRAEGLAPFIEPLGTMWVNAIRMTVVPLIVSSLIVAAGNTTPGTVGRLGIRAVLIFTALIAVAALISALVAPQLFRGLVIDPRAAEAIRASASAVDRPALPSFAGWLVSIIPVNAFKAAVDGAMLSLVFFSLLFGLALGRLEDNVRAAPLAVFRGVAEAMTVLVRWVLVLAPIGVFSLAFGLALKIGAGVVGAVAYYIGVHIALLLVGIVFLYVAVMIFSRVPVTQFARALFPAQMVAVTTRSSMAALPALLDGAQNVLRLPQSVSNFGLPFASSIFRFNQGVTWVVVTIFSAKLYGVELAPTAIASVAATSVLMNFSVPGIPSASLLMIAPFLAAYGIPPEAIGVLIAVDLVPDLFKTPANVTAHLAAVTILARNEAPGPSPTS